MSLEPEAVDSLLQSNDQTALYEHHGRAIFGYLCLHLSSLEDAEDLLLEVFLASFEHANLTELPPGEQLAWLRRVAHNKLANTHRRFARHPQVTLDAIVETLFAPDNPEQLLLQKEEHRQLQAAISKLPILQQHMLQLRYSDGLRCSEIALLLMKREGTVRRMLSRSILFLRQVYEQIEGESTC